MPAKAKPRAMVKDKVNSSSASPRTSGEAARIKAVFDRFDQNCDGMIDRGELAAVLAALDRATWTDKRVDALLSAMDLDRDRRVSYKDFVDWLFGHRARARESKRDFLSTMDLRLDGRGSFLPACVRFLHDIDVRLWAQHIEALTSICDAGIADAEELIALLSRNHEPENPLDALRIALQSVEEKKICRLNEMLGETLPFLASLVLQLPVLFRQPLPLLVSGHSGQVFLTRRQCGALLAAAFFGVLPKDTVQATRPEFAEALRLPEFSQAFILSSEIEKVLCHLCYFRQLSIASETALAEMVSFARSAADPSDSYSSAEFWQGLSKPLTSVVCIAEGTIEDAVGCLQADFANKSLGGGVLFTGCVQEEIRFTVCPECLVGLLLCDEMLDNEAIYIVGTQQYSEYIGYGRRFQFAGPRLGVWEGSEKADLRNRRGPHIVAFDALRNPSDETQFGPEGILRELQKVYIACLGDPFESEGLRLSSFATGNWGCGAFGGDVELKFLIQWLAASAADRSLRYYTFQDRRAANIPNVATVLRDGDFKCRDLYELMQGRKPGVVFSELLDAITKD